MKYPYVSRNLVVRTGYLKSERKTARERIFREAYVLFMEKHKDVFIEDRKMVVRLVLRKLNEETKEKP